MTAAGAAPARPAAALLAWGIALPAAAGAAAVLGFAPFHAWPVPLASLAILFIAWSRSGSSLQAAISGFAFGLGLNLAGVSWVYVSLHEFGHMPAALAAVATFLFCAYLALFPAAAGWLSHRFPAGGSRRLLWAMPAAFVLLEWVRGWLFTGFPWLAIGYSQAPASPLAGFAPVLGAYGVSLAAAFAASLLAAFAASPPWSRRRAALAGVFVALLGAGAALKLVAWTSPAGPAVPVALLQGNVPQHLKWREEVRNRTLRDYHDRIVKSPARVVVLPETALPAFLDQLPPGYLESLREHAQAAGKDVLIGSVERRFSGERFDYWNSVVRVGAGGPAVVPQAPPRALRRVHPAGVRLDPRGPEDPAHRLRARRRGPAADGGGRDQLRGGHLLRGHLRRGSHRRAAAGGRAPQREQRRVVRRVPRRGPAPAVLADARARDRPLDGARDEHRGDRGDRREGAGGGEAAAVHRRGARGEPRAPCRGHAFRAVGKPRGAGARGRGTRLGRPQAAAGSLAAAGLGVASATNCSVQYSSSSASVRFSSFTRPTWTVTVGLPRLAA